MDQKAYLCPICERPRYFDTVKFTAFNKTIELASCKACKTTYDMIWKYDKQIMKAYVPPKGLHKRIHGKTGS